MSKLKGHDSNSDRESFIVKLMRDGKPEELKYLVRFLEKNLKIGAGEKTMQGAMAKAFYLNGYYSYSKKDTV